MKIWIEKTKVKGRKDRLQGERAFSKVIWSPTAGSDGRDTYKNMRLVEPGDFVIHFIDNKEFTGISVVSGSLKQVEGLKNTQWDTACYLYHLQDFHAFSVARNEFLTDSNKELLNTIAENSEVFYQTDLNLRQGAYLTPCPLDLFNLINQVHLEGQDKPIPFYNEILSRMDQQKRYWLYAPGENARNWEEFYKNGIMGLGWDEIGDLKQYDTRDEIKSALVNAYGGKGSKKNDVSANDDFLNKINIGDVIIAKKGRGELLGYGVVTSNYEYDNNRSEYQKLRQIDWKLKGNWKVDFSLVLKTLTDITKYSSDLEEYNTYYERLLGIMGQIDKNEKTADMNFPLNTILYGPPGTGKTYNTILRAAQIIENRAIDSYYEALKIFKANLHDKIEFITFHQNYSYEDFIQGLRPDTENDNQLTFERKDGVFKEIADKALKNLIESEKPQLSKRPFEEVFNQFINPLVEGEIEEIEVKMKKVSFFITAISNKSIDFRKASGGTAHTLSIGTLKKMYLAESVLEIQGLASYYTPLLAELLKLGKDASGKKELIKRQDYVMIIDEINRANISRVFGELITLIEPDKRSHGTIPLEARLPSGDSFIVPSNLFIIGTMNTADKSIALLDIALRRRFEFESMYPKYEIKNQEIYDVEILKNINKQIIKSKGHDFQIGHAYFMGDNKDLVQRMNKKVIPLLLEYYMNDEKEVKGILNSAGLIIEENSWPLKISGKND